MRSFVLRLARLHPVSKRNNHLASSRRRTGQALLLAVLLMIFAALVASTFITVVALNMDATSTQEERQRAASAAAAGANVVNYQINANGTGWRPEQVSPPPAPGDPEYSYYYTAQDLAHGYQRTTAHPTTDLDGDGQTWSPTNPDYEDDWIALENGKAAGQRAFVKFPDPRLEQNTGSHTYMAEVAVAGAGDGTDKQGMLRVTVVGQSSDDPNVYVKRVGYKGTSENGGAFAWDQFFTNWNYRDQKTIATTASSAIAAGTNTITVGNAAGFAPGRLITIQDSTTPTQIENALVQSVNANTNTMVLSSNVVNAYPTGSFVRGAVPLANGLIGTESASEAPKFNADGVSSNDVWEKTKDQYRSLGYGLMSNGDIQLVGKTNYLLNANSLTSKFYAAGTILPSPASAGLATYHAQFNNAGTGQDIPTTYGGTTPVGSGTGQQLQVKDNPTIGQPEDLTQTNRNVQPITPPDLTNFPRYLEITKYTSGGVAGLGDGLYIGNGGDVEKVSEGGALRPLTVADMQRWWQGKSFPALVAGQGNADHGATGGISATTKDGHRLSFPRVGSPTTDSYVYPLTTGSLEQRGIRGWVNTYEFVPRGAKIDVQPTQVVITLDDRSDFVANQPDPAKAWGYAATALNMPNCYRMVINTDSTSANFGQRSFGAPGFEVAQTAPFSKFNGVIYAEGNLRVRGVLGNTDLAIVSMNNIYIEGNLVRGGTGRFGLMARKNVVLNPTKFISTVQGSQDRDAVTQTIPVTATSGTGADNANALVVSSLKPFRVGDDIRVGTDTVWHQVIRKTGTGLVLKPVASTTGAIKIKSVAATVTAASSGNIITVSATAPFRYGDAIRVDDKNWVQVVGIDTTNSQLTLSATLNAAIDDSVQILTDPDFVPGANVVALAAIRTANGWPNWPTNSVPAGSTTGDYFESPEWFYRLTGPRDVLARDMRFDGISPGVPVGSGYQLSTRMIAERKEAFKLKFDSDSALPAAALGLQKVKLSENTNSNTVISSGTPNELLFSATDTYGTPLPNIGAYSFDSPPYPYDLLTFAGSPSGTPNDSVETMSALKSKFNTDQHYVNGALGIDVRKWELLDADVTAPTSLNMTTEEAASIAARYFLPLGLTAGTADDWTASRTDPKRLYLSAASRQYVGATLDFTSTSFNKFGAAESPTANGDVTTSDSTGTSPNAKNFYWYPFTSGATTYERQQWLRWSSRPMASASNTNNIVAVTTDSAINSTTGSIAPLRVAPFKLERSGFDAAENPYNPVNFTVQATIFAQEGSWFVIPMPLQHRNDVNNSNSTTVDEISYATRMRRANYQVTVKGRIVQNFAPSVLADYNNEPSPSDPTSGPTLGPSGQWADSLSYPGEVYLQSVAAGYRGRDWFTINYAPDTSQIPVSSGLILPPSPDFGFVG